MSSIAIIRIIIMNAITLIGILCLVELCTGTISPSTGKEKKDKGKTNSKVGAIKRIYHLCIN